MAPALEQAIMKTLARAIAAVKSGLSGQPAPFKAVMDGATPKTALAQLTKQQPPPLPKAGPRVAIGKIVTTKSAVTATSLQLKANVKSHEAVTASMQRARQNVNSTAANLSDIRSQSSEAAIGQRENRLVDLIYQELLGEPGVDTKVPANSDKQLPYALGPNTPTVTPIGAVSKSAGATAVVNEASVKAASAVELIEKIETFMKSQRPGLAISLEGSLGARVEIERLGPKEVAVRVVGKNGPPSAEDIGRIRDEIRARGLKVGALSVA